MPRIDDYINARKIAIETLAQQTITEISGRSGFNLEDELFSRALSQSCLSGSFSRF
jgi:hypothetical protein